jgi:hypothetical protein
MATDRVQCMNFELNSQMCPCTYTSCGNWGICCECMANHAGNAEYPLTTCMRTPRPQATLELLKEHADKCINFERNMEICACSSTSCSRKGTCCDCVRNHWTADATGRTTCMR